MHSIAVLGIGNTLLQDDGAGMDTYLRHQHGSVHEVGLSDLVDALIERIRGGDTDTFDERLWEPKSWPRQCRGVGVTEAPRGALSHWGVIEEGKIANHQAVVPSTWNAGPREAMRRANRAPTKPRYKTGTALSTTNSRARLCGRFTAWTRT